MIVTSSAQQQHGVQIVFFPQNSWQFFSYKKTGNL
jgi:hypothetical protein